MIEYTPSCLSFEELIRKARSLPSLPGIYQFYDRKGEIIYVGKSRALHDRVLSYFRNRGKHTAKTEKLVQNIADFQTVITSSEREALILENEKIKYYQPKFNIRLKDDKDYPYIRLSVNEDYPRLSFARRRDSKKDAALYFGPYGSSSAVRAVIDTANKIFSLPTCHRRFPRDIGKERPCLYYQMGRCIGVCTGTITPEEYRVRTDAVIMFLKHDHTKMVSVLKKEMEAAAQIMNFEKAARLRDQIRAVSSLGEGKQVVRDLHFHADVFDYFADESGGCVHLLRVREGKVIDSTNFHFGAEEIFSPESFSSMLTEWYRRVEFKPRKILIPASLWSSDLEILEEYLSSDKEKVHFHVPLRGEGRRLLEMARNNAEEAEKHRRSVMEKDEKVLVRLASLLELEVLPERIESIDISNSGKDIITAGIISIVNSRFCKKDYKTFHIRRSSVDDPASVYEAYSRRLQRYAEGSEAFSPLPDLILVDGSTAQIHAVRLALREHNFEIPVFGMVKDSFHKTRCLTDGENEISIAQDTVLFRFIYKIQEEVHRFTVSGMDRKRRKTVKRSALTEIEGIGEKKASILLKEMKKIDAVRKASVEQLTKIDGISRRDAVKIYEHYHNTDREIQK